MLLHIIPTFFKKNIINLRLKNIIFNIKKLIFKNFILNIKKYYLNII